jgi:hypothetical protein
MADIYTVTDIQPDILYQDGIHIHSGGYKEEVQDTQYNIHSGKSVFLSGQAGLSGGFQMRTGPGCFSWQTKPKQNILFERFSTTFTKKVSKVRNINHIQLNHRSPAIAVFHPSTRPRLMQADAGCLNHVQAGF